MKVRIGIDVGGTFTDAVLIDNETYELIGQLKVPTTHDAPEGVAAGIVQVLHGVMERYGIQPEDVTFIAHGTTQATNALLEGDVVPVGVVGMGSGLEGMKARTDTNVGRLELAPGRFLETLHQFTQEPAGAAAAVAALRAQGAQVIVAAAPFSVDDSRAEEEAMAAARQEGLPAVGTHEISKLYGLKIRTRTAVINASILPKMVEAATMTDRSVQAAGVKAPLMIMRCDGGVMSTAEIAQRPILTMLSGPAAGVAGALMYEKISNGLFLEVGGTSTDISAVVNGRVMVDYAEVGGHKTYVNSLDVRTVGIAGGSLIRFDGKQLVDVGPRSAHIAGLHYAVYSDPEDLTDLHLVQVQPKAKDPADYLAVENSRGQRFALTVACASNLLGLVQPEHYAHGSAEAARRGFVPLAAAMGCTVEAAAEAVLKLASAKNSPVVQALLKQYELDPEQTVLVGGGGGAAAIVPHLAKTLGMQYRVAKNAQVISPIGVALAMVRDVVERTVAQPTQDDILAIRREAEAAVMRSGADPTTIEIHVEVDAQRNILRAVATGATALRTRQRGQELGEAERARIAAESMRLPLETVKRSCATDLLDVFAGEVVQKKLFGLLKTRRTPLRVVDREGVIRLQQTGGSTAASSVGRLAADLRTVLTERSAYGDAGIQMPKVFVLHGGRILDLSGLLTPDHVAALAAAELGQAPSDDPVIILLGDRAS
jgi:N-methylhydantoinase A